jgi:hypothetical protein
VEEKKEEVEGKKKEASPNYPSSDRTVRQQQLVCRGAGLGVAGSKAYLIEPMLLGNLGYSLIRLAAGEFQLTR